MVTFLIRKKGFPTPAPPQETLKGGGLWVQTRLGPGWVALLYRFPWRSFSLFISSLSLSLSLYIYISFSLSLSLSVCLSLSLSISLSLSLSLCISLCLSLSGLCTKAMVRTHPVAGRVFTHNKQGGEDCFCPVYYKRDASLHKRMYNSWEECQKPQPSVLLLKVLQHTSNYIAAHLQI